MNKPSVVGLGVVSAYGSSLEEYFGGLLGGKSVLQPSDCLDIVGDTSPRAVAVPALSGYDSPDEKIMAMGTMAIKSALADWGGTLTGRERVGFVVGSGLGLTDQLYDRYGNNGDKSYLSSLGARLAAACSIECETVYIGNACCAGSQALCFGADLLESGDLDIVIAGGIDVLSPTAYAGFLRLNAIDAVACRPFDKDRRGITVGEGAVFFILTKLDGSAGNAGKVYCRLAGSGVSNDAYHTVQMRPEAGEIIHAMETALSSAGLEKKDVGVIIAHGTGTVLNDKIESAAIRKFFGKYASDIYVTAPKGAIGHTGGASGAFGFLTAIGTIIYGKVPPVQNLQNVDPDCELRLVQGSFVECEQKAVMVDTFAFGGTNVVIICEKIPEDVL